MNTKNFTAKFDLSQKAFDNHLLIDFGVFGASQKRTTIYIYREQNCSTVQLRKIQHFQKE